MLAARKFFGGCIVPDILRCQHIQAKLRYRVLVEPALEELKGEARKSLGKAKSLSHLPFQLLLLMQNGLKLVVRRGESKLIVGVLCKREAIFLDEVTIGQSAIAH